MRISDKMLQTLIDNEGELLPLSPTSAMGVLRLALDLRDARKDIIALVLRLMGEDPDTFSPEVSEVMSRYASKAMAIIKGGE